MTDQVSATFSSLALALGSKYEVKRLVGSGGFAEVYEVWDKDLERRLAVKVLRPDVAWTSGMIERFQRETRAAAKLEHPNILPIHFVGGGEGLVYYAMPFVDGMSLGELLKRSGALPPERALAIIIPILDALDHAHKAGLLHRDIKPDNIMLDVARGRPLLVDFGIARRLDSEAGAGLTQTGLVIGTPHYMSPEQALGDPNLGPGSDLYSLGCVLFQMVTGDPPFDGESSQQVVGKHISEPPPAAHQVNPKVPRDLSDVIARCLAKQSKDRYRSAAEVIAALEKQPASARSRTTAAQAATELLVSGATKQRTVGQPALSAAKGSDRRTVGSRGWIVAVIAVAALVIGAGAFFLTRPKLEFENALTDTVTVQAGPVTWRIPPGEKIALEPGIIVWRVVRPRAGDRELGLHLGQQVRVQRGTIRATPRPGTQAYFEPLITNETGRPITIVINAGLAGAVSCNCTVPAGAVRMPIGYYPLFQNSTVRAEDPGSGATATFTDLGPRVDRTRGTVGLKFRAEDLRQQK